MIRLKDLRTIKGVTQKEVAKSIGVSPQSYGYYENEINKPDPEILIKLADYFECTIDYLVGRENDFGVVEVVGENQILTNLQKELLHYFDKMSESQKHRLIGYAFAMVNWFSPIF